MKRSLILIATLSLATMAFGKAPPNKAADMENTADNADQFKNYFSLQMPNEVNYGSARFGSRNTSGRVPLPNDAKETQEKINYGSAQYGSRDTSDHSK